MEFALPLLLQHRIPFTYFVSTNQVLRGESFPHDLEAKRPLPANTLSQLRELAAAGVEIGAHTRGHVHLGPPANHQVLVDEIVGSKRELEKALEREVAYFSFPYGQVSDLSPAAFQIAREAGFLGVCSAFGGYNFPGDDSFHLRRIHADPELVRLKNWMTIDPRKLQHPIQLVAGDYRSQTSAAKDTQIENVAIAAATAD